MSSPPSRRRKNEWIFPVWIRCPRCASEDGVTRSYPNRRKQPDVRNRDCLRCGHRFEVRAAAKHIDTGALVSLVLPIQALPST